MTLQNLSRAITLLFSGENDSRNPVRLTWRVIQRKGSPFLLLPKSAAAARAGLNLYSAQRTSARIARSVLGMVFRTPAAAAIPKLTVLGDTSSELLSFLDERPGVFDLPFCPPAIMLGPRSDETQRFVMLAFDAFQKPVRVIKAAISPQSRVIIESEANFIQSLPANVLGSPKLLGRLSTPILSAFSVPFHPGKSPRNDARIDVLLRSWIHPGSSEIIETTRRWAEFATACAEMREFRILAARMAKRPVRLTVQHGDLTAWNARVDRNGDWCVFDWEQGDLNGLPGWDWFHFVIQNLILVKRDGPERVAEKLEFLISSARFQEYAEATEIAEITKPLLLAYLVYQKHIVRPSEGLPMTSALHELLSKRWRL